jgi:hypothetical protein
MVQKGGIYYLGNTFNSNSRIGRSGPTKGDCHGVEEFSVGILEWIYRLGRP